MEGLRFQALDHIEVLNSIHTSKFEKKNSVRFSKHMEVWSGNQRSRPTRVATLPFFY